MIHADQARAVTAVKPKAHGQHGRDELEPARLPHRCVQQTYEHNQHAHHVGGISGDRLRRLTERERSQKENDSRTNDDPILPTPLGSDGSNLQGTTSDLWNAAGAAGGGPQPTLCHGIEEHMTRQPPAKVSNKYLREQGKYSLRQHF
jgi:hypothetical protein